MKLKRILAGALAGVMAITSSVVTSFTASADVTIVDGLVVDLSNTTIATNVGTVDWGSSSVSVSAETLASFNLAAGDYLTIDFTTESGGQFYCTNFSDWSASATWYNNSGTATVVLTAAMVSEGIRFNGDSVTIDKVSFSTVNAEYEAGSVWELNAPVDWSSSSVAVSAEDLAKGEIVAGTTYLKINFTTESGGQFYCTNFSDWSASATWHNTSGSVLVPVTSAMVSEGIRFNGDGATITTITAYNPPSTTSTYKVNVDSAIENGTLTVTDEDGKAVTEAAEGTVIVIEAEAKEGYKLSGLTVNGVASEESFEMPAKDVTISAKFAPIEVETVTITPASATIVEGKTTTLAATVAPEDALDKTITWSSSDEKVATVDAKGVVTAVAAGKATITAKSANGKTAAAEIEVSAEEIPATNLEVICDGLTLYVGDESNIGASASIEPANTTDTIIFTSSDTKVATVDEEGMVKAVAPGEAVIKVTTKLNDKLSVDVKVTVLDSGDYADGTWTQLSDEQLADVGELNTITAVKDEYVTTENTLSLQYNATEKKLRIYKLLKAEDLKDKSGASIVVKKGNVALQLTTDCLYKTLAKGQEAPEGSYYVAWVIKDVENPADFSYSDIVLE